MAKKNIIVTGGAGFIGSHIARRFIDNGYKVFVLDDLSTGFESNIPASAEFIKIDLGNEREFKKIENLKADAILHLAGQSSGEASFLDPHKDFRSHVVSTFALLEYCRQKNIERFMYASSMAIYGDPQRIPVVESDLIRPKTYYAAAKASAESYINFHASLGLKTTIFRLFSVYGPGQNLDNKLQGMISIYLSFILENKPILVKGSKDRFRDFVYIDDVVDAWELAFENPKSYGKTYNVAGESKITVEDVITTLKEVVGDKNYPVEFMAGTKGDQFGVFGDAKLLMKDLSWEPKVKLLNGLQNMFQCARKVV